MAVLEVGDSACNFGGSIPAEAGVGLRFPHHRGVIETKPDVAWFEVHPENYMGGGPTSACLEAVRADYPLSFHGTGLSLGSADDLDRGHLERLCHTVERFQPALVSEHLSWSVLQGHYLADLLPLPLTEEALSLVCHHVNQMQDGLGRRILLENPSSYFRYRHSTIPEWEFLAAVARQTGCGILCDVNNIYVSAFNHDWDPRVYLEALTPSTIGEVHLAGHSVRELDQGHWLRIDDHSARVAPDVWALYEYALTLFGPVPTLIEWDTNIPAFEVLLDEANNARNRLAWAQRQVSDADTA